ncbi:MAG: uncharacterized protein KVP18_001502 [Porospora cf. gigantea A]|uniref:uncharacterized protein n=1 Tax=Porospora cf. gigantea A TaxID=2853593 RepID=UPI003559AF1D|nr:MAG: hypothetical protein KVP18_001502 [Porospora cf. gigantea A]
MQLDGSVQPRSWVCGSSIEITEAEQFVGEDRDKQLFLRLCLLSATDLAAGDITGTSDPYVELHWGSEVFSSPVVDKTLNPTWDYTFEFELRPVGSRSLLLQVWDADFGRKGDFLGQTRLEIPEAATKINSEVLDLDKVPSGWFSRPPPSRLRILWTVVDNLDDQPDLLETATKAGGRSSEPVDLAVCVGILESQHSVDIEDRLSYVRVSLNELPPRVSAFGKPTGTLVQYGPKRKGWMSQFTLPQTTPEDVVHSRLQLEWLTQKATPAELQQARRLQFEPPPESTTVSSLGSALLDDTLVPDVAKLDVVREGVPPSLKEPSGSAVLPKTKHKTKQNAQPLVVEGHFSAGLDQMQETCEDTKACWAARAQLLSNTATTGEMLVYVTVKPIKDPPLYIVNLDVYPPPQVASLALAGKQAKEEKVETVWLRSYADFLPKMDTSWNQTHLHSYCDPYVSVKVDHLPASRRTTSETKVQDNTQREVDFEALGVDVPTRRRRQKIVVSVLDSDCPIPGFASMGASLIGQARVSSITYDSLHWHHMFGGSSEGSRLDISESMIKGVLKGSTYRGSLCTVWSRSRNKPSGWPPYPDVIGTRMRLEIGVDRGLYLASRYRERNVSLLVQVAGCALDVSHDDGSPLDPQKAHTSSSFGSLRAARKLSEISPQNADVLEFPGYVDGNGVLRFHGYQWPAREHSRRKRKAVSKRDCGPYASAGLDLAVALPDATLDVKLGQNAAWVSRVSGILNVLPDVDYAYVYLVPEGEEDSPPQLYGCIRLTYPSGHVEKSTGPTWPPAEALAKSRKYSERQRSVPAADITTLVLPERSWEWIKLTWDESVVPVPESRYPSNFGGALRLSARMVPARETEHLLTMVHQEVQHRRLDLEAITALFPQLSAAGETESSMKARSTSLKDLKKRLDTRYVEAYVPEPITTRKTCSLDTTHQRVGSPGLFCFWDREGEPPPVVFQEGDACLCGNAYFHTDVLQAVNLPSLDETSGVNAFWEILIEDRVISSMNTGPPDDFTDLDELLRPSRFPSFLQRAVVPITLKKGDFPPCVIRLYDLDPPSQSGYCQRELIGTAVDWDVPFLEHRNPTNYSPNEAHEPIWYHLNSPTQLPPPSHSGAPRVLACCGFSFECADFAKLVAGSGCIWHQDNQMVKWPVISMVTRPDLVKARTMSLSFDLTVLGLRGLSAEADSLTLTVSSFWKETAGRVAFALPREELPAPNVIRLAERSEGSVVIEQALLDAMHSLPYMAGMQLDTPVGMVVRSPVFSTPVLPYLQTPALSRPALILPEVSLVLSDNTNQEIARSSLHVSKNWINDEDLDPVSQAQRGLRTLDLGRVPAIGTAPPDLTGLDDISYRVPITTKSAQITWVDMFTDRPGFVLYDEDCFCGRMIRDQDAFYLQGVEDADQDAVLVNPSDCVLGDPNRVGWVFADPELGVDSSDLGPNPEEFASFWKALFHEKTRNEPSAREGSLERALRSWIRPVGHVCRTLAEDGSCLLARYNLLDFEGHRTTSMVNVVSAVDAEVVWRRETNVKNAGDTILVLRGLKDRKYYSVGARGRGNIDGRPFL